MKYISLEDIEKARLNRICSPEHFTEFAAGQLDGWNKCIDALMSIANTSADAVVVSKLVEHFDEIYADEDEYPDCEECRDCGAIMGDTIKKILKDIKDNPPQYADYVEATICTEDDRDKAFLEALTNAEWEKAIRKDLEAAAASPDIYDESGIPDCEECRFSGLLTDD